jgi:tRNA A-37 threonylcarbamoyl transferase component Bud32
LKLPLPIILPDLGRSSTQTTKPRNPRVEDATIELWDSFIPNAIDYMSRLKRESIRHVYLPIDVITVESEKTLETKWNVLVSDVINRTVGGKLGSYRAREVIGDPDFVFVEDDVVKVVGELQTWWAFPFCDLVENNNTPKVNKCIAQVYGYMTFNCLRYVRNCHLLFLFILFFAFSFGFLTNYINTWFLERVDCETGTRLRITSPLKFDGSSGITIYEAFYFLLAELIHGNNYLHIFPTSSPYPSSVRKASKSFKELEEGNKVALYPRHLKVTTYISQGADGKVFKGVFCGRPCVMKIFDVFQREALDLKACHEVDILKCLSKERISPQFYGFGNIMDLMSVIAMEEGDVNWTEDRNQFKQQVIDLYQRLHALDIIHNDVEERHILQFSGGLRLVDFGNAKYTTCSTEKNDEMALVHELFSSKHV